MAKRTNAELYCQVQDLRWLVWEVYRTSETYRVEVAHLLRDWHRKRFLLIDSTYIDVMRFIAARRALAVYKSFMVLARQHTDLPRQRRAVLSDLFRDGVQSRWNFSDPVKDIDLLPELGQFDKRWGLAFPLPPSLDISKEVDWDVLSAAAARPVRVVHECTRCVTLRLTLKLSRDLLVALALGVLNHYPGGNLYEAAKKYRTELDALDSIPTERVCPKRHVAAGSPVIRFSGRDCALLTLDLPVNMKEVRSVLSAGIPPAANRFRRDEQEQAIQAGRLKAAGRPLLAIGRLLGGGEDNERCSALARNRLVRYRELQKIFLPKPYN